MKKRSEQELKAQNNILEAHHKKRQAEAETFIKELGAKCRQQQEGLKAKLFRLHEERFDNKKKTIEADCTLSLEVSGEEASTSTTRTLSSQEIPLIANKMSVKSQQNQHEHDLQTVTHKAVREGSVSHDAVIRQKRRKGLMNNATIQLAIEIHNEGIIAMTRSNNNLPEAGGENDKFSSDNQASSGRSSVFIPWGIKARSFLYSIVVGEIPSGYFFDQIGRGLGRVGALGGGLVKCMMWVDFCLILWPKSNSECIFTRNLLCHLTLDNPSRSTDTRTSDDTAIAERSSILAQVQVSKSKSRVEEIERRYNSVCSSMQALQAELTLITEKEEKIAAAHKEATLQFDRATQTLNKFKAQAQHFFNIGKI